VPTGRDDKLLNLLSVLEPVWRRWWDHEPARRGQGEPPDHVYT
jgi:hypothetical protein